MTSGYGRGHGEGLPLSAVNPLAEGARRGRSKQVANTPPNWLPGFWLFGSQSFVIEAEMGCRVGD